MPGAASQQQQANPSSTTSQQQAGAHPGASGSAQQSTSESDTMSGTELTWIQWFCSMRGNEFFCEVDEEFIQDEFNLYGLSVPHFDYALDMILDNDTEEDLTEEQQEMIERNAEVLYGLIHARFVLTARGQQLMLEKFKQAEFGRCPRVFCNAQPVLPVGLSDTLQQNTVKLFCPRCGDIFFPRFSRYATIDGAYFGTTFPHLLLLQYPELLPQRPRFQYVPKIFGFKLHPSALVAPVVGSAPPASPQKTAQTTTQTTTQPASVAAAKSEDESDDMEQQGQQQGGQRVGRAGGVGTTTTTTTTTGGGKGAGQQQNGKVGSGGAQRSNRGQAQRT